jgi:hypothetical protein
MVMSGALWACSGDDNMGGAGGSAGLGGTSGSGGTGGTADAGKDSAPDGTAGSTSDARSDGSGGSGGSDGSMGTGGADASRDGSGGAGGAIDASAERDAVAEASSDARDGSLDQGTPGTDTGSDAPRGNDGPIGSEPQNDAISPSDVTDAGTIADASDGNNGQVTSDASSDHTACGLPAGGTTYFSFNGDVEGWSLSDINATIMGLGPGPGTTATWSGDDGCPSPGPGQLRFTMPIDIPADASEQIQGSVFVADLPPNTDWTGRTALHVKVKVETQGGLEWLNPFVQFNNNPNIGFNGFLEAPNGSTSFTAPNLGVNVWNDLVIPMPSPDAGQAIAGGVGLQIFSTRNGLVQVTIDSITIE